ncbi:unnamed protein product [Mortierella alpina]
MAYTTVDESTFYVQGGFSGYRTDNTMELTDQFFALDLTKNWTSTSPRWEQLNPASAVAGPKVWGHSMAISKSSVVIWSNQASLGVFTFSLTDRTWGAPVGLPTGFSSNFKLRAVLDPSTGLVYVPYGMGTGENMPVYNSNTRSYLPTVPMTPATVIAPGSYGFSSVWSTQRSSVLVYGGRTAVASTNTFLAEYSPTRKTWSRVSLIWTKGAEAEPIQRRSDMACTASGDNFVAWGGETRGLNVNTFGTPIIYNLKTNTWTTEYLILPELAPALTPGSSPDSTSPSTAKGMNAAAIGGGVAAAAILILAALFVYKRRQSRKDKQRLSSHSLLEQGQDRDKTAGNAPPRETVHAIVPAKEEIPPPAVMQYQYTPVATLGTQDHHALGPLYHYVPTATADHQYHTFQAAEHQRPLSSVAEYHSSPSTTQGYHSPASTNQMYPSSPPTTSIGYSLSPAMATEGQQSSPSISTGSNPYSPTPTAVYQPPPPTAPAYPLPPGSNPQHDRYSHSGNVKVESGPDVRVVRNPQTHVLDSEECEPQQRPNQPQSRPTSSSSSNDERLKQEIAFLKAQQEQQYLMQQQNMERLRLEQQELVELLKKQIKP